MGVKVNRLTAQVSGGVVWENEIETESIVAAINNEEVIFSMVDQYGGHVTGIVLGFDDAVDFLESLQYQIGKAQGIVSEATRWGAEPDRSE
jgi:hypothetical protein